MKYKTSSNIIQGNLFSAPALDPEADFEVSKEHLIMPDAKVFFYKDFFRTDESDSFFKMLLSEIDWRQDKMNMYGKEIALPRKTAWYGDKNRTYTFSGIKLNPKPWTETLLKVKKRIESVADTEFNSVLLNLYRDGNDGISWHTDAEPELGENPVIGSVSFGGSRRFMFRHRYDQAIKSEVELTHGSFLLMAGETQHFWQHQVPKTSKRIEPRINLTFRVIMD